MLIVGGLLAVASGFTMEPLLTSGSTTGVALFLAIELFLMGVTFAPMGALLPELFPTHVRYTGASAAYNLGGIVGASAAPFFAQQLVSMGIELGGRLCVGSRGDQPDRRLVPERDTQYRAVSGERQASSGKKKPKPARICFSCSLRLELMA